MLKLAHTSLYKFTLIVLLPGVMFMTSCQKSPKEKQVTPQEITAKPTDYWIGDYGVMGYKMTPKALEEEVSFASVPKFEFLEGQRVKIEPDFSFGMFQDGLYTYTIKGNKMTLKSQNETLHLRFVNAVDGMTFYFDSPYLSK